VLALIHLNGDVCLSLNGDILFVQGYSCRKENFHFNPKDSTMEPRLSQNMQIVAHQLQQVASAIIVFICGSSSYSN
jgi:hypothetical protein